MTDLTKVDETEVAAPVDLFISDHKALKRTVLLWAASSVATFALNPTLDAPGNVSILGVTVAQSSVPLIRIVLALIAVFYFFQFCIAVASARRRHSAMGIDARNAELLLTRATKEIVTHAGDVEAVAARFQMPNIDQLFVNFGRHLTGTYRQWIKHQRSPNEDGVVQTDEEWAEDLALRSLAGPSGDRLRGDLEEIGRRVKSVERDQASLDLIRKRFESAAKKFNREARSLSGRATWQTRVQFFFFDFAATSLLVALATYFAFAPTQGHHAFCQLQSKALSLQSDHIVRLEPQSCAEVAPPSPSPSPPVTSPPNP